MHPDVAFGTCTTANAAASLLELKEACAAGGTAGLALEVDGLHAERPLEPLALLRCVEVPVAELCRRLSAYAGRAVKFIFAISRGLPLALHNFRVLQREQLHWESGDGLASIVRKALGVHIG